MNTNRKIEKLRELMYIHGLDAYMIPSCDHHLSEYVAECRMARSWISGFTGSVGTVVITGKESEKIC